MKNPFLRVIFNVSPFYMENVKHIQNNTLFTKYVFSDTKGKYSRQVGVSKFLSQQRQHSEPAIESDNVFQDAGASDILQVLPGFQKKVSHGLWYFSDDKFHDKRQ